MPEVLRHRGYRVGFFSSDWNEPCQVHVSKGGRAAKFWLKPVRLARNAGFRPHELRTIALLLEQHEEEIWHAWNDYFG